MKPSPLSFLTPFVAFGLKSKVLNKLCKIFNVVYCTVAVGSFIIFAHIDPLEIGWVCSGAIPLVFFWIVGSIVNLCQIASINDEVETYNIYVNTVFAQINAERVLNAPNIDAKLCALNESTPLVSSSLEDIENINSPFSSDKGEIAFDQELSIAEDHSINSDSAKAIAEALVELNKEATQNYKLLNTNNQKDIIRWLSKKYFNKLSTKNLNTMYTAKKADIYKATWKEKFEPLFRPQATRANNYQENSATHDRIA